MLQMLHDLIAHKGHADASMLAAIRANEATAADPEVRDLLAHVLLANRFWLATLRGLPFDLEVESRAGSDLDDIVARYRRTHLDESAWVAGLSEADLARMFDSPHIPGNRCSLGQALMQVCLHSQGHRAQCAKLLRRHGSVPPMTDFILWLTARPSAEEVYRSTGASPSLAGASPTPYS